MGRKILYGALGIVFGFIIGAIILSAIFPSNPNASGPNYGIITGLLLFALVGAFLGIKFANSLNTKYGDKPLSEDKNASKIQASAFLYYSSYLSIVVFLSLIFLFCIGYKIPFLWVALCLIAAVGSLYHYKNNEGMVSKLPEKWLWLKQSQWSSIVKVTDLYIIPIGTALVLILYLIQKFG